MISFLFRFVFIYLTYARATAETFPWGQLTTTGTKPSARYDHSSVVYNGKMVVFGGYDGGSYKNDAWTLDLTTFAWALLTTTGTKPSARSVHSSVVSNGKMVVFGGHDGSYKNDAWTLDLSAAPTDASTRPTYSFVPALLVCVVAIFA